MEDNKKKKKKVMVAIDENECSHYALKWALDNLYDTLLHAHLVIFTVQPNIDLAFAFASASTYVSAPPELVSSIQEKDKKFALALLEKAKDICSNHGIKAETVTEVGDPKEKICEAVDKFNVELLVLGSHGRGTIQRAFLGSVSNYCVHRSKCPVLVVKKPD